ncbi:Crp/Fnr family transcriptional regulator [Mangrovibacterium lignilyticum]|uniref:Crp/Fnr family transcriptional regulator n=1 Tax=Mangrovibacterium lignilyticum TaxID=2668052 RepID=UPI0013D0D7C1|nr:Crp/Fnr family transcriptional regulator [Mangrovibacterium lignilyticum]
MYILIADFFAQFGNFSDWELSQIVCKIQETELKAGEYFQKTGSKNWRISYLLDGVLGVLTTNDDGNRCLRHLITEKHFFTDLGCQLTTQGSAYAFKALCPCRVSSISLCDARQLITDIPALQQAYTFTREESLLYLIHQQDLLRQGSPSKQYLRLLVHHPEIFRQLPMKYIADYLGITQRSLSRIRKSCH